MKTDVRETVHQEETRPPERRPRSLWLLVGALIFQGILALGGGVVFLADTDGGLMGIDVSTLEGTPVDTYLIPGLLLVGPLGLIPLYVAWALIRRPRYRWMSWLEDLAGMEPAWSGVVAVGLGLLVWIVVEYLYIDYHWLQAVMGGAGVAILALAALPSVRRHLAVK